MLQQQLEDAQQTQTVLRAATRRSARSTTREEEGEEREKGATEGRRGSRARCCRMMMTTMAKMMIQARRRGIGRRDVVSSRHATAIESGKGTGIGSTSPALFGFGLRYYVRVVKFSVKYFILTLNTIYKDGQALSWAICSDCGKLAHGILLAKKMLRRWVRADAYVRFSEARSSFPAHAPLFKFHIW